MKKLIVLMLSLIVFSSFVYAGIPVLGEGVYFSDKGFHLGEFEKGDEWCFGETNLEINNNEVGEVRIGASVDKNNDFLSKGVLINGVKKGDCIVGVGGGDYKIVFNPTPEYGYSQDERTVCDYTINGAGDATEATLNINKQTEKCEGVVLDNIVHANRLQIGGKDEVTIKNKDTTITFKPKEKSIGYVPFKNLKVDLKDKKNEKSLSVTNGRCVSTDKVTISDSNIISGEKIDYNVEDLSCGTFTTKSKKDKNGLLSDIKTNVEKFRGVISGKILGLTCTKECKGNADYNGARYTNIDLDNIKEFEAKSLFLKGKFKFKDKGAIKYSSSDDTTLLQVGNLEEKQGVEVDGITAVLNPGDSSLVRVEREGELDCSFISSFNVGSMIFSEGTTSKLILNPRIPDKSVWKIENCGTIGLGGAGGGTGGESEGKKNDLKNGKKIVEAKIFEDVVHTIKKNEKGEGQTLGDICYLFFRKYDRDCVDRIREYNSQFGELAYSLDPIKLIPGEKIIIPTDEIYRSGFIDPAIEDLNKKEIEESLRKYVKFSSKSRLRKTSSSKREVPIIELKNLPNGRYVLYWDGEVYPESEVESNDDLSFIPSGRLSQITTQAYGIKNNEFRYVIVTNDDFAIKKPTKVTVVNVRGEIKDVIKTIKEIKAKDQLFQHIIGNAPS